MAIRYCKWQFVTIKPKREKKPYGITLITCNSTLVYIIDYLRGPVSGNFDVKMRLLLLMVIVIEIYKILYKL